MLRFSFALAALLAFGAALPLSAQTPAPPQRNHTISASPILALFEILQADYELRVGTETTAGLGVGYWSFGDEDENDETSWLAVDLKGRFYPDEAFDGFAIGGMIGLARIEYSEETGEEPDIQVTEESATGFSFGVEVSRAWLLGDEHRWYLAAGLGAKRYYFDEVDDNVPLVLPTGRLGFGLAF